MCLVRVNRPELQTISIEVPYPFRVKSFWPGFDVDESVLGRGGRGSASGWKRGPAKCHLSDKRGAIQTSGLLSEWVFTIVAVSGMTTWREYAS